MSTRRARIKAVASLPVRRKNAEVKAVTEDTEKSKDLIDEIKEENNSCDSLLEQKDNYASIDVINKSTDISENPIESSSVPELQTPEKSKSFLPEDCNTNLIVEENDDTQISNTNKDVLKLPEQNNVVETGAVTTPSHVTEIIDGIVPLVKDPKLNPLNELKNEIISENAEVSFDPIVPIPSPSKMRPKLRPVPRLGLATRNSIQGSASESEDESRRALISANPSTPGPSRQRNDSQTSVNALHLSTSESNRVRNDSISSAASQSLTIPPSPQKDKHLPTPTKIKREVRHMNAVRRKQRIREISSKKSNLTMYDLIFYNPHTNPIVPDKEEEEMKQLTKEDQQRLKSADASQRENDADSVAKESTSAPAPQIKIGPDGNFIVDEKSLVIEETDGKRKLDDAVVREGNWSTGHGRYSRTTRTADWSSAETVRFYRALAAVGTDFSMMASLFPHRTRRELKSKFKKEERNNGAQVDKAMESSVPWDILNLEEEFKKQRADEIEKKENAQASYLHQKNMLTRKCKTWRRRGVKVSKGGLAVGIYPEHRKYQNESPSLDEILLRHKAQPETQSPRTPRPKRAIRATTAIPNKSLTPIRTVVPSDVNPMTAIPQNIEKGSLVVLSVDDPNCPSKKILQTYMTDPNGVLTAVNLPPVLFNSVAGYIKKTNPGSPSPSHSPALGTPTRPNSRPVNHYQISKRTRLNTS